jgi:hypothetical protein
VQPLGDDVVEGWDVVTRLIRVILYTALICSTLFLVMRFKAEFYRPGNQQDYEPIQPIAFSHQQHTGKLQISCLYCHSGAESSRHAGRGTSEPADRRSRPRPRVS